MVASGIFDNTYTLVRQRILGRALNYAIQDESIRTKHYGKEKESSKEESWKEKEEINLSHHSKSPSLREGLLLFALNDLFL